MTRKSKKTVHEIVTEKIIEKLEAGTVPWHKPWASNPAVNWQSQRPYTGINQILLDPGEYATFNQIQAAGGKVKKGAKSHIVTFYKTLQVQVQVEDEETDKIKQVPYLRYYRVFALTDTEGLKSRAKDAPAYDHDPIEAAEAIIKGYRDCPPIAFAGGKACYMPAADKISIPPLEDFCKREEYYSTLLHELVHSTGHPTRLARPGITVGSAAFGTATYSREELVAEVGAAMLCGSAGIEHKTLDNSASYIQSWLKALRTDSQMVVWAASRAQKAADYILGKACDAA